MTLFDDWSREAESRQNTENQLDNYVPANNADEPERQDGDQKSSNDDKSQSQATIIVDLVCEKATLFHDSNGHGYAVFYVNDHREVRSIYAKPFKDFLIYLFYQAKGKAPGSSGISDALATISSKARYEGDEYEVATRITSNRDGSVIYIDMCDSEWRAIEIDRNGWCVVSEPPVYFVRYQGMKPLPDPAPSDDPDLIWRFMNIPKSDRPLVQGWLDAAMRPSGPYPILVLQGEQGSAKSTQAKILRSLIDPSIVSIRSAPKDERDLMISGNNGWVVSLDNLSGISGWISDALCRISTGGGFATRELYTDIDEVQIDIKRPIVLNGIDDIATRHDLIDRSVILNLERIPDDQITDEDTFWPEFEKARPQILGHCLDRVSKALRDKDSVTIEKMPRMADFAKWAYAAGGGDDFIKAYRNNRKDAIATGLEGSPVAQAIRRMIDIKGRCSGTATELLNQIEEYTDAASINAKSWPKSPKALSSQLRRLATGLRSFGIEVSDERVGKKRTRTWHITQIEQPGQHERDGKNASAASADLDIVI